MRDAPDPAIRTLMRQIRHYADQLIAAQSDSSIESPSIANQTRTVLTYLDRCQKLNDAETFLRLMFCFGNTLLVSSNQEVFDQLLTAALSQPNLPDEEHIRLASTMILLLIERGELGRGQQVLDTARVAATTPTLQAEWWNRQGNLLAFSKQFTKGEEAYLKALALAEQADKPRLVFAINNNLGDMAYMEDRLNEALPFYMQALQVAEELNDLEYMAAAEMGLGMTHGDLRQFDQALLYNERARQHAEAAGDMVGLLRCYNNFAYVATLMKEWETCKRWASETLLRTRQLGDRFREGFSLHLLGEGCLHLGEYEAACAHLIAAIAVRRELKSDFYLVLTIQLMHKLVEALQNDTTLEPAERATLIEQCLEALGTDYNSPKWLDFSYSAGRSTLESWGD